MIKWKKMQFVLSVSSMALALLLAGNAHAGPDPEQRALHVMNRLAYGPGPGDIAHVSKIGAERYIEEQLEPASIALPAALSQRLQTLSTLSLPASQLLREYAQAQKAARDDPDTGKKQRREMLKTILEQSAEARLVRAISSPRQLEETMVDFWFNHFNVFSGKGLDRVLIGAYERDAIRPHVLGNFRDLLGATAKHPAMLFYLDNWKSVAPATPTGSTAAAKGKANGLNENYARELMELHTLGVDGGYTQKDVTELARMLTGWTFSKRSKARRNTDFHFDESAHDWDKKEWLGRQIAAKGQQEGESALDILAAHPSTARRISHQLAQYFVNDSPPPALVDKMARQFLDSRGNIKAVLRTMFQSAEFWEPGNAGVKFKTPYQYVVSAVRAAEAQVVNVRPLLGTLTQMGMPLYGCQTPDGYKNTEQAWANAEALALRINFATALAAGRLPLDKHFDAEDKQGMGKRQLERAAQPLNASRTGMPPVSPDRLKLTLHPALSSRTLETVGRAQQPLRAALMLGSPDFMRH